MKRSVKPGAEYPFGNAEGLQLALLVDTKNPDKVMEEVGVIFHMIFPDMDLAPLKRIFLDVLSLFEGNYPGYRACNIKYHDLQHTMDTLLGIMRLIHGATVSKHPFSQKEISLGLASALLHDTGYMQTVDDTKGTGAKYTLTHINRSIDFMDRYFTERGFSKDDVAFCSAILNCTGLNVRIERIPFLSPENEVLGKMLGTADLLGQMADRAYLEKLPSLFREFKEGKVPGFKTELDLLRITPQFYTMTKKRLKTQLGSVDKYMGEHFRVRWNIEKDLYGIAIQKQIRYLEYVLENYPDDYRQYLRRGI
ncbi:MAG: hypothetical protein V1930_00180 [Pseudomonadota bacterium]